MKKKIFRQAIQAADSLSLGISMVIAILIGVGLGYLLKIYTGIFWLFWIGVAVGVAAAILNVYKAYKAQVASYEEFKDDKRYKEEFCGNTLLFVENRVYSLQKVKGKPVERRGRKAKCLRGNAP